MASNNLSMNDGGFYDAEPSAIVTPFTAGLQPLSAALGDPSPAWPLPGVHPGEVGSANTEPRSFITSIAKWIQAHNKRYGRRSAQICAHTDLEHVGIDLPADTGILVVAPEEAIVARVDQPWQDDARATVLRTHTGLLLLLGGLLPGSHRRLGVRDGALVKKGDPLGRIGPLGALHLEVRDGRTQSLPARWWRGEPAPEGIFDPSTYLARMIMIQKRPRRPQPTMAELLLQWRLLQSRRAEYARLATGSADPAAAATLLRADVKSFIDRLRPPSDAAEAFFQLAPEGWRERMELLLDADPLVPNLIARSEVQRA